MRLFCKESTLHLRHLSRQYSDPQEAYARMVGSVKAAESYITKIVVRNMFNKLISLKVGTEEVNFTARRVVDRDIEG